MENLSPAHNQEVSFLQKWTQISTNDLYTGYVRSIRTTRCNSQSLTDMTLILPRLDAANLIEADQWAIGLNEYLTTEPMMVFHCIKDSELPVDYLKELECRQHIGEYVLEVGVMMLPGTANLMKNWQRLNTKNLVFMFNQRRLWVDLDLTDANVFKVQHFKAHMSADPKTKVYVEPPKNVSDDDKSEPSFKLMMKFCAELLCFNDSLGNLYYSIERLLKGPLHAVKRISQIAHDQELLPSNQSDVEPFEMWTRIFDLSKTIEYTEKVDYIHDENDHDGLVQAVVGYDWLFHVIKPTNYANLTEENLFEDEMDELKFADVSWQGY